MYIYYLLLILNRQNSVNTRISEYQIVMQIKRIDFSISRLHITSPYVKKLVLNVPLIIIERPTFFNLKS